MLTKNAIAMSLHLKHITRVIPLASCIKH